MEKESSEIVIEEVCFCKLNSQWEANQVNMSKGVLANTLMVNQLIDMDWKFGGNLESWNCLFKCIYKAMC